MAPFHSERRAGILESTPRAVTAYPPRQPDFRIGPDLQFSVALYGICLREGFIEVPALLLVDLERRRMLRLIEAVRIVDATVQACQRFRIVELDPSFLKFSLVDLQGGFERWIAFDLFYEVRIDPRLFIESLVALLECLSPQLIVW
ncbi:MAG TPA: hypothetical protein VGG38_03810 [Acidimicrobiales bacterium]